MMTDKIPDSKVRVDFKKSPAYSVVPATGVWVTKTIDGHLLCNFVVESEEVPENLILGLNSSGQAISEEGRNFKRGKEYGIIKEFMVGVMMTPAVAVEIGRFLMGAENGNVNVSANVHVEETRETDEQVSDK